MRDMLGLVAGYGLLTVTGNDHKQMRKAMNPAFSIPNLSARAYFHPLIDPESDHIIQRSTCIMRPLTGAFYIIY